jgi:hypothetical protein
MKKELGVLVSNTHWAATAANSAPSGHRHTIVICLGLA